MRGRSKEEIEEAIIMAIRKGSRSAADIMISANVGTHTMTKRYLQVLIDKGRIEEAEPSIFDHGHVKKIYKLLEAEDLEAEQIDDAHSLRIRASLRAEEKVAWDREASG